MRLLTPLLNITEPYPVKDYSIRPKGRRDAVGHAIDIFEQHRDRQKADEVYSQYPELSDFLCSWVTETLLQGAYIREYHAWEREVKSFLNGQRHLNGVLEAFDWSHPGPKGFVTLVRERLREFSATIDDATIHAVEAMRRRVNGMKHVAASTETDLVSKSDYDAAAQAIEDFWRQISAQQMFASLGYGPHIEKYLHENP